MRAVSFAALIVGVLLIPTALGVAQLDHDRDVSQLERSLTAETEQQAGALESYFARARANILLTANSSGFARVLAEPGTRAEKVRRQTRSMREVTHQLAYLERLYPASIGETCFIDARGEEYARVVRGDVAPPRDLSTEEELTVFFAPTFALRFGQVHQTEPYVSPDTKEWVIANAALIPQPDGHKRAFVHFEVTMESFRRVLSETDGYKLRIIDAHTGAVVIDGDHAVRKGARLSPPGERRVTEFTGSRKATGVTRIDGRITAFRRIRATTGNINDWYVAASTATPTGTTLSSAGPVPITMLAVALIVIALAGVSLRTGRRELEAHANTDALTGLGNRRKLLADLERRVKAATGRTPLVLTLFDLNGFKNYNDSFGHPAGDALLSRLGHALAKAVEPFGGLAYRPGGDEFSVIAEATERQAMEQAASLALSERGEGFAVSTAFGSVVIPQDTGDATEALRKADAAMYGQKNTGRPTAGRQSSDVLLRALAERHPDLGDHQDGVAELAGEVAERMGVDGEELRQLRHAAALHDIGKVAIPDAIITKPTRLNDDEWGFMRRHTLIGERIVAAAPALGSAAPLVRSSHEAWDGSGYPDGLAGVEIPLGSRIIAVCDAFDAMISCRPYATPKSSAQALAELRRCSGTQFDPAVVDSFREVLATRARSPIAAAPS
jgi:diguanylate cyclase (GGDEF)-like protein